MFHIDWDTESCEVAAWLNMDYGSQGFVTEAVKTMTQAFLDMGFKRIVIRANTKNIASRRIAEKCGFDYEGIQRSCEFNPCLNQREDFAVYSKISDK